MSSTGSWRWFYVGLIALPLALTACGDVEKSDEYQGLLTERDSIAEELTVATDGLSAATINLEVSEAAVEASEAAVEASETQVEALRSQLTSATSRAESTTTALVDAHAAMNKVEAAARAETMLIMWITPEFYDEWVRIGVPVQYADRAVALLEGPWSSLDELAGSYAAYDWGELVRQVGDPELTAAWRRWYDAEIDSDEELAALIEVETRLLLIILEGVNSEAHVATSHG
jgi:hypothetical protein